MKKLLTNTRSIFLLLVIFTAFSCQNNSSENLKEAELEVVEAEENLIKARAEYKEDMIKYRSEMDSNIIANEQRIQEFKTKEAKADYDKSLSDIEQKNSDMKRKLDEYKIENAEHWNSFKFEFNHDMHKIGEAINSLTVNDVQ